MFLQDEEANERSPLRSETLQDTIKNVKERPPAQDHCCTLFVLYWWVVPKAQTHFWDLWYQTFTFDLFHRRLYSRFIHMRTIPTNVVLTMVFFAQFKITGETVPFLFNGAAILLILLGVWYIICGLVAGSKIADHDGYQCASVMGMVWGSAVMFFGFVAWILATAWYELLKVPDAPWYNPMETWANPLVWIYIVSFIQASSHMCEDVPPLVSGCSNTHWENPMHFYMDAHCGTKVLAFAMFPVGSVFVAYISWPHLIGSVVLLGMFENGYIPLHYRAYLKSRTELLDIIDPPNRDNTDASSERMELYLNPEVINRRVELHLKVLSEKNPTKVPRNPLSMCCYEPF